MEKLFVALTQRRTLVMVSDVVDSAGDSSRIGHRGRISAFSMDVLGASEEDPYWTVRFPDGSKDGFWSEELSFDLKDVELRTAWGVL